MGAENQPIQFKYQEASEKLGKIKQGDFWGKREKTYKALIAAEKEKQSPVYFVDVCRAFKKDTMIGSIDQEVVKINLYDLWRNDQVLASENLDRFSLNPANQHTQTN